MNLSLFVNAYTKLYSQRQKEIPLICSSQFVSYFFFLLLQGLSEFLASFVFERVNALENYSLCETKIKHARLMPWLGKSYECAVNRFQKFFWHLIFMLLISNSQARINRVYWFFYVFYGICGNCTNWILCVLDRNGVVA